MSEAVDKLREVARKAGTEFADNLENLVTPGKVEILAAIAQEALDLQVMATSASTAAERESAAKELAWVEKDLQTKLLREQVLIQNKNLATVITALQGALAVIKVVAVETLAVITAGLVKGATGSIQATFDDSN